MPPQIIFSDDIAQASFIMARFSSPEENNETLNICYNLSLPAEGTGVTLTLQLDLNYDLITEAGKFVLTPLHDIFYVGIFFLL